MKPVILSKQDSARMQLMNAICRAQEALRTSRGTAGTRKELREARDRAWSTNICEYCGGDLTLSRSPRHNEACAACGSKIDRMLMSKSKVLAGTDVLKVYQAMLEDYAAPLVKLPRSLRGATGDTQDIVEALERVVEARLKYDKEVKEQNIRDAARNIEKMERASILEELVQCGADPNSEETLARVDEIYQDRRERFEEQQQRLRHLYTKYAT